MSLKWQNNGKNELLKINLISCRDSAGKIHCVQYVVYTQMPIFCQRTDKNLLFHG
jgi:hypothetical protein